MVDDRRHEESAVYHIRVQGSIGTQWSSWFDDLEIVSLTDGETLLAGPVVDQAALHGILAKIRDMNLPLLSVTRDSIE
jgi:hypothetical protein